MFDLIDNLEPTGNTDEYRAHINWETFIALRESDVEYERIVEEKKRRRINNNSSND